MNSNHHTASLEDETSLIQKQEETTHYPVKIVTALYVQLLAMITLIASGFLLPVFFRNEMPMSTDTFSVVNYMNIIIWIIITISTWYVKAEHKISRVLGYHEFYDMTRHLHRVAFYTMSGGNILLLVVSCVTHNFCLGGGVSPCSLNLSLTPVNYQQIIFMLEIVLCIPFLMKHIIEVTRFNESCAAPDVLRDESAYRINYGELAIGIRGPSDFERILERQADQLITLNHRNQTLTRQIYLLTDELIKLRTDLVA